MHNDKADASVNGQVLCSICKRNEHGECSCDIDAEIRYDIQNGSNHCDQHRIFYAEDQKNKKNERENDGHFGQQADHVIIDHGSGAVDHEVHLRLVAFVEKSKDKIREKLAVN